jgi:hypothetical protein
MKWFRTITKKNSSAKRGRATGRSKRLVLESLEVRRVFAVLPYGAFPEDTAEFMLGTVAVTPVFLESNGQIDANTENWTPQRIQSVLQNINEGMQWWVDALAKVSPIAQLEFKIDTSYATTPVPTKYEPISRISNDYTLWVSEFLTGVGYGGDIQTGIRGFNHAQRTKLNSDWSFTIFVVASQADADGQFAVGGSFSRAFAFAGGLFQVVPETRPASTFAHETGHMFWARDEYMGGGSFGQRRGYYNTQNLNAADNPTPGFVQQPSLMASGTLLETSYATHFLPASTMAMIGWQDSDGDGIFDVLDVPLKLQGSGYFDSNAGVYRFQGEASVQTLPNLNSSGFKNDITINRVRDVEYRVDGGSWQTFIQPGTYVASLDLTIPVPANANTIEIRARDSKTTVTSNVFTGRLGRADATPVPGINGYAWIDANKNGLRDAGEFGASGWTVNVLSSSGQPLSLRTTIEPDSFPDGQFTNTSSPLVTLRSIGLDTDGRVGVFHDTVNSTGTKNFRAFSMSAQSYLSTWTDTGRRLQINFTTPTNEVEIDAIGAATLSYGRLEAYNSAGQLLGRYTTSGLASGVVESMKISRGSNDIAYAIASGHTRGSVRLDHLRFGPKTEAVTGPQGQYSIPSLPPGSYQVQIVSPDHNPSSPTSGRLSATVVAGISTVDIDLGFTTTTSQWQNSLNRLDVNNDGRVSPLDALLVINDLNRNGGRVLAGTGIVAPPYVDVSGDGRVSPLDALLVINALNSRNSAGSAEGEVGLSAPAIPSPTPATVETVIPEGEAGGELDGVNGRSVAHALAEDGIRLTELVTWCVAVEKKRQPVGDPESADGADLIEILALNLALRAGK